MTINLPTFRRFFFQCASETFQRLSKINMLEMVYFWCYNSFVETELSNSRQIVDEMFELAEYGLKDKLNAVKLSESCMS